jgi:outer membrane protein assembly factor BamD (BamD/ComL family)
MTSLTPDKREERLADIDVREREAWETYQQSLRDLQGKDYEEAEDQSWDRLQKRLRALDEERQLVAAG